MRFRDLLIRLLYAVSGLFTLYWASVFFIGTEDTLYRLIAQQGLLALFLKRFLGFAVVGGLIAVGITLPSLLRTAWHRQENWSEAKQVFQRALLLQVLCALLGSVIFAVSISGSKAEEATEIVPSQEW